MKLEELKEYWEEVGKKFDTCGRITPTSRDPFLSGLEESNIMAYLHKSSRCLELGCGDGVHSAKYAKKVKNLSVLDISNSLISLAKKRISGLRIDNIGFTVGSVLDADDIYDSGKFDRVISQRCLINLPTWRYQKNAIRKIHDLIKPGGLFLVSEGFQDGLDNLNNFRSKMGLPEITVARYNNNLIRKDFEAFIPDYFDIVDIRDYGFYLFLSRVFHPLAVLPEQPKHDSRLNEAVAKIFHKVSMAGFEKYSYNLFYVLRKKKEK